MHFLTPSLLCGNWEVEHALFDTTFRVEVHVLW